MYLLGRGILGKGSDKATVLENLVDGRIRLALAAHKAAQRNVGHLAVQMTIFVDVGNLNLHRSVVLGRDDSVGGHALARDVQINLNQRNGE